MGLNLSFLNYKDRIIIVPNSVRHENHESRTARGQVLSKFPTNGIMAEIFIIMLFNMIYEIRKPVYKDQKSSTL